MSHRSDRLVLAIGAFKLVKVALLIGIGVLSLRLAGVVAAPGDPEPTIARAAHWVGTVGAFPGRHVVLHTLDRLWSVDPHTAETAGLAAFGYAVVFLIEGVGLLRRKRWAEWLTVVVTASFIPIEIWELVRHFGAGKIVALALNVAIAGYLASRRLEDRRRVARPWRHAAA